MTTSEYERIKQKIQKAKETEIRAKGACDRIEEQWEKKGINSKEMCNTKIEEVTAQIDRDKKKKVALLEKLENVTDWSVL